MTKNSLIKSMMPGFFIISLLLNWGTIFAAPSRWHCQAYDQFRGWRSHAFFSKKDALKNAYYLCKKKSKRPSTCHVSAKQCWKTMSTLPPRSDFPRHRWRCKYTDSQGRSWIRVGQYRYKAHTRAKHACQNDPNSNRHCKLLWCHKTY